MLNLFVNSQVSPRGALVASVTNPVPIRPVDLILGSVRDARLYIVDGAGDYDDISGDESATVLVTLGTPTEVLWASTDWTAITNGWSGTLAANTEAIGDLFNDGSNPVELELGILVADVNGNPAAYSNEIIKIWNRFDASLVAQDFMQNAGAGTYSIPASVDTGSVTGLGLALVPSRVFATVRKPTGGVNLGVSIQDGTITTDGFTFYLTGATDQTGYKLDYLLVYI